MLRALCIRMLCAGLLWCGATISLHPNHEILADEGVDLPARVAVIFEQHCIRCHTSGNPKGGLSLATKSEIMKGGESGRLIVPEMADDSLLLEMISGDSPAMPADGKPLTPEQVSVVRQWIQAGATLPDGLAIRQKILGSEDWWSFQPVVRPQVPVVANANWGKNDIDRFIFKKLEEQGLTPSAEADRRTLIRRLSFDLLGLPPTAEEIDDFVNDPHPQACEILVERMLSSTRYGERWARHWLDIAHYADTHGFERDQLRENAWRYRDYVIRSFNTDKPYNDFLLEQIAGDVLRPNDPEAIIATGFLAAGPWDFVGQVETSSPALNRAARADDLDDMVTQVLTSTLGLTVNCARCHDHKLDPILQREYYQLWSVFSGVKRGDRECDPVADRRVQTQKQQLQAERTSIRARQTELRGTPISLAEIAGGGNGQGSAKPGSGIDPVTGLAIQENRGILTGVETNTFRKSSVSFVDGVVVPDASEAGTVVSSTGLTIHDVPKTSGQVWDAIRFGPVYSQFSTKLGEIDFNTEGHSLLSLHANVAITFDLQEIRQAGGAEELKFTSSVGYFGQTSKAGGSFHVYVDGQLAVQKLGIGRDDGLTPIQVDLPRNTRFLTLMATDHGNGIGHDQICFGDAGLSPAVPPQLNDMQLTELAKLDARLIQVELELKSLPAPEKYYGVISQQNPATVHVLNRGDSEQPGEEVMPGGLHCLAGVPSDFTLTDNAEGSRRLALAKWITDPANPLTRRVLVNRLWHYHFGVGIVDTPSDFGYGGGRPTHSELLDYLADEFQQQGWSLKKMHRLICTSAAYRQQSTERRPREADVDSGNRLLWRMNPRRLDAESLWDATLSVTAKLNPQMYGPGFRDFEYTEAYAPIYVHRPADSPELWRRAIYRFIVRTTPNPFLSTLDCPNPANLTPARNVTTTALQSLALLNNGFLLKQSEYLAERVRSEAGELPQAQVPHLFRVAFGRDPSELELQAAFELLKSNSLPQLCRMILNANEFVYID